MIKESKLSNLSLQPLRDLAWALLQTPLFTHIPDFDDTWLKRDFIADDVIKWCYQIEQRPNMLFEHMADQRSSRLGLYFEHLLAFYFTYYPNQNNPRFQVLAKNYQVQKLRRTLGEFDFIIYDKDLGKTIHLETSLKFYLGHKALVDDIPNNLPYYNWHHWVGPNKQDTLAKKMIHLKKKQLPLSQSPLGLSALKQLKGLSLPLERRLLFSGRFYFPRDLKIEIPSYSQTSTKHWWTKLNRLIERPEQLSSGHFYCILPRSYWLSEFSTITECDNLITLTADELLAAVISESKNTQPVFHVIELAEIKTQLIEHNRFFIIP